MFGDNIVILSDDKVIIGDNTMNFVKKTVRFGEIYIIWIILILPKGFIL